MTNGPSAEGRDAAGDAGAGDAVAADERPLLGDPSYRMSDWGTLRYAFSVLWHHLCSLVLLGLLLGTLHRVTQLLVRVIVAPLTEAINEYSPFVAGVLYAALVAWVGAAFVTGYHYAILGISQGKKYPFERAFAVFTSGRLFLRVLGTYGCFAILFAAGQQLAYTAIPWEYLFGDGGAFGGDLPRWAVNRLYDSVSQALGMLLGLPLLWAPLDAMACRSPVGSALRHGVQLASANLGLTAMMAVAVCLMCVLPAGLNVIPALIASVMQSVFYREMTWREREPQTAAVEVA